jgi:PAS domain S-box-containing protein
MNESLAIERTQVDEEYRTLVDFAPDALFVGAREGLVLYANRAACALCGQSSAELQGRPLAELLPLQSLQQADSALPAPQPGAAPVIATRLRRADAWAAAYSVSLIFSDASR